MRLPWRWLAVLAAAGLAACQPPIVLSPQEPPSGADGRYRGTARLIRADNRYCPRSGPRVLEVSGGAVRLSYSGDTQRSRIPLTAPIASDGRVQASDGIGAIDGQLQNGQLGVTVSSRTCEHRWTLTKVN